jgi:hypothetical protein
VACTFTGWRDQAGEDMYEVVKWVPLALMVAPVDRPLLLATGREPYVDSRGRDEPGSGAGQATVSSCRLIRRGAVVSTLRGDGLIAGRAALWR